MKNPLKTIIVDDEASARRKLRQRLKSVGGCSVVAETGSGNEALSLIRGHRPDLVFLDIQMPGMDGFDVLRALPRRGLPEFVFITASDDFAIAAFRQHRLDYLLKPVSQERVAEVLLKARERHEKGRPASQRKSLLDLIEQIARPSTPAMRAGHSDRKRAPGPNCRSVMAAGQPVSGRTRLNGSTQPAITCACMRVARPLSCARP